ncbi:AraC family transcriptional regulator [Pseudoalteromonas denitrificans]|uniref:Transcriptional regulator, AraC family n=1 Tax=Pseudoalteromonas denitrificans DSM 6059 TaxID=1123010 RepID=A0A1I1GDD6_9GAMM|nr:AraC family transcriptional regulator [Pseudoalteromonas denitrificans]SFC07110.1 transcriptional regulator, AraC family [Pseudoalteromonas denitrificans DSM 6059]
MDKLTDILNSLSFNAEVFFSGNLCGVQNLGGSENNKGHLHLLKAGTLTLMCEEGHKVTLDKPSVLFMPGPTKHKILSKESHEAELVCVDIDFNSGSNTQLINTLPKFLCIDINQGDIIGKTAHWLFEEAFNDECGRQIVINKLCDIFLVQILRHVLNEGLVKQGMLAGLSHPQISNVMSQLKQQPEDSWTIDSMAHLAGMSRSKFAASFKDTVGQAPNDYLIDLRLSIAKDLLKQDKSVGLVANKVGYEHGSALARVFRKKLGLSPKEWLIKLKK